jgi:hypothetical protein
MRILLPIPLVIVLALLMPAPASAVTVKEIVSLSKAGVSEQVILALIDRDKTIFNLPAEQFVTLQKEGVSDAIVLAMLRSGRDEPPPTAPAAALQPDPPEPNIVVVGHEPDRPNAPGGPGGPGVNDGNDNPGSTVAVPYFVPVPYVVPGISARSRCVVRSTTARADVSGATGLFFLNTIPGLFFPNPAPAVRVTECPPAAPRRSSQKR